MTAIDVLLWVAASLAVLIALIIWMAAVMVAWEMIKDSRAAKNFVEQVDSWRKPPTHD